MFTACYHVVATVCVLFPILEVISWFITSQFPADMELGNSITHVTLRHASYKSHTLSVLLKYNCAYSGMPAMPCSIEHSCSHTVVLMVISTHVGCNSRHIRHFL